MNGTRTPGHHHDGEPDAGEKGGHDGAKSQDYKAHDKSDPDDEQDNLEDRHRD